MRCQEMITFTLCLLPSTRLLQSLATHHGPLALLQAIMTWYRLRHLIRHLKSRMVPQIVRKQRLKSRPHGKNFGRYFDDFYFSPSGNTPFIANSLASSSYFEEDFLFAVAFYTQLIYVTHLFS
jgi:hypothetical protein